MIIWQFYPKWHLDYINRDEGLGVTSHFLFLGFLQFHWFSNQKGVR